MNKQLAQEQMHQLLTMLDKVERSEAMEGPFAYEGNFGDFRTALNEAQTALVALLAKTEAPEFNTPLVIPTEPLVWAEEDKFFIANVEVPSRPHNEDPWKVGICPFDGGFLVDFTFILDDGDWSVFLTDFASVDHAKAAVQYALTHLNGRIVEQDGSDKVCEEVKDALLAGFRHYSVPANLANAQEA